MRSISISARVGDQYARSAAGHQQFGGRVDDNIATRSLSLAYCVADAFENSHQFTRLSIEPGSLRSM